MSLSAVTMPRAFRVSLLFLVVVVCSEEVFALERTALALNGSGCRESRGAIIEALEHLNGVAGVETDLIPDHVLIDHDGPTVNEDRLAAVASIFVPK